MPSGGNMYTTAHVMFFIGCTLIALILALVGMIILGETGDLKYDHKWIGKIAACSLFLWACCIFASPWIIDYPVLFGVH